MISEQLKKSILQAAIQGKLTVQLHEDGNARDLLKEIRIEKDRLVKEGKFKKEKPFPEISIAEIPFKIPENWSWVRLGEIANYKKGPFGSSLTKSMFIPDGSNAIKVYEQKNAIQKDESLGDYYIDDSYYQSYMKGFSVNGGDIIISCAGTIGESFILPIDARIGVINQALMRVRTFQGLDKIFFQRIFDFAINSKEAKGKGSAIKNIPPFETLKNIIVPLPPLTEQRRIVSRLDEVFLEIDRLNVDESKLDTLHKSFPNKMKDSILQYAIQGKLTYQLDSDGNARDLLKDIKIEKTRLISEGKIKKEKPLPEISKDEFPFEIPENWCWVRLESLSESCEYPFADGPFGSNLKSQHYTEIPEVRIIQLSNIGENGWRGDNTKYTTYKHLETIARSEVRVGDIVIAKMMPAGRAIEVPNSENKYVLSSDAIKFVPNKMLDKSFLLYAINSDSFRRQIYLEVHGITRIRTSLSKVKTYLIPLPPLAEQHRIVELLGKLLPLCEALE